MEPERPMYSSEESVIVHVSTAARLHALEVARSDYDQRFDTLQTELWKRVWFWIEGWPWVDLNAPRKQRRPWRRGSWRWRKR